MLLTPPLSFRCLLTLGTLVLLGQVGCGSGTEGAIRINSSTTAGSSTGLVAILVTDAPADSALFSEINATIHEIELLGGENGKVSVLSGEPREINLLDLREYSLPLGVHDAVPTGDYCKIRLWVDSIELVFSDGRIRPAELPGNGKLDLILRECLEVEAGESTVIQVDIDAAKSIHVVESPPGSERYLFRPVIQVDLVDAVFAEKLLRIEGVVARIGPVADIGNLEDEDRQRANEILVCDAISVVGENRRFAYRGCVTVQVDETASLFDNIDFGGEPRPLADLFDPNKLGAKVTVVGEIDPSLRPRERLHVSRGHYPPRDRCKIWYEGRPPGHQPEAIDCPDDRADVPADAILIDDEGRPVRDGRGLLTIDARVVQLGDHLRLMGTVEAPVDVDQFPVLLEPDQAVHGGQALDVLLQAAPVGGNGTRILSTTGDALSPEDIQTADPVTVDGVLVLADPDVLRAALVIVDLRLAEEALATGTVIAIRRSALTIVTAQNPCDPDGDSLRVVSDDSTSYVTLSLTDEASTTDLGGDVVRGDAVSVTGLCESDGSFTADTLIVIDDRRAI